MPRLSNRWATRVANEAVAAGTSTGEGGRPVAVQGLVCEARDFKVLEGAEVGPEVAGAAVGSEVVGSEVVGSELVGSGVVGAKVGAGVGDGVGIAFGPWVGAAEGALTSTVAKAAETT